MPRILHHYGRTVRSGVASCLERTVCLPLDGMCLSQGFGSRWHEVLNKRGTFHCLPRFKRHVGFHKDCVWCIAVALSANHSARCRESTFK